MATIKSYTDLEQSRKLAEILPLESADMYYKPADGFCTEPSEPMIGDIKYAHPRSIPCWSLAALLSVIKPVNDNTYTIRGTLDGGAFISFDEVTNVMYQEKDIIDAVYNMVIWLHEKNVCNRRRRYNNN